MKISKKWLLIGSAVLVIGSGLVYLLWGGLEKNVVYFVTPTELVNKGSAAIGNPVRLGGVVEGIHSENALVTFRVTDQTHTISVMTTKTPPQMFQEGIGVVVEGALRTDGTFEAERLMVKHGNEYRPPKEGEMPQEIYREMMREKGNPS